MALESNVSKSIFQLKGTTFFEENKDATDEMKRRVAEAEEGTAAFLVKEAELLAEEKAETETEEREVQRAMQKQLINSGLRIMKKEKVKQEKAQGKEANEEEEVVAPPTYTRMSLQYLDLETLLFYGIDYERDTVSLTS